MNKKISWLAGLFGLQLILATALFLFGSTDPSDFETVSLLQIFKVNSLVTTVVPPSNYALK